MHGVGRLWGAFSSLLGALASDLFGLILWMLRELLEIALGLWGFLLYSRANIVYLIDLFYVFSGDQVFQTV